MDSSTHILVYVGIAGVLAIAYFVKLIRGALAGPLSSLPGPAYTKVTAWPSAIRSVRLTQVEHINQLHLEYGPVVRVSPTEASISDIDTVKKIYAVGSKFIKSDFYDRFPVGPHRNVFDVRSVESHSRKRRLLGTAISEGSLLDTYQPQIRQKAERCVERISEEMSRYGHADILKWNSFMTTDLVGQLSFGSSFEMLETGKKSQYSRDLEAVRTIGSLALYVPQTIRVLGRLRFPGFRVPLDLRARLNGYAEQSIDRHSRQVLADPDNVPPTLLSKLYARHDQKKDTSEETMDFRELIVEARANIVAGTDTTASGLTYMFWELARHPEVQTRLSAELNALPADFTAGTLREAPLLSHVIDETLRLHSPVPALLPRTVPEGGLYTCGHFIPPGCSVGTQAFTMHRDSAVFPAPEEFQPDRWVRPTQAMKDAFRPFGGGSRICIGKHLAVMELRLVTALLYRRHPQGLAVAYGATLPDEDSEAHRGFTDDDMKMNMAFLMGPKGLRCLLRPRAA